MPKLKRALGPVQVVFFATGVLLGAGIYTIVGKAAGTGGNLVWLSFLIASLAAFLTALSYSELLSVFPSAGGEYEYSRQILGPAFSVFVGCIVAMSGISGGATIAVGFAGYFNELLEVNQILVGLLIISAIFLVNVAGIKQSSAMNMVFTIIETGGLIFVIICAWPYLGKVDYLELPPEGLQGVMTAAALSFFAFTGFEDSVKLAEETRNPERNLPRALFISLSLVALLYVLTSVSAVSAVPFAELGEASGPLAAIAEQALGRAGAVTIAVVALFSTSNSLLSNMMGASRITFSMAREHKVRPLRSLSSKRNTPVFALILAALIMAALSLIGEIGLVANVANFFVLGTFLMVNLLVIIFRYKDPNRKRAFRIPVSVGQFPVFSGLAILLILVLLFYSVQAMVKGVLE